MKTNEPVQLCTAFPSEARAENDQPGAIDSPSSMIESAAFLNEAEGSTLTLDDLAEKHSAEKKRGLLQSQRLEELESYLKCIVRLCARIRELELDASL